MRLSRARTRLAAPLSALEPSKRQPHVEALVLKVLRAVGGSDGVIVASTPLMEAGIDSLAATELVHQLREATGLVLSPTLVFECPTPRAIAAHVLEELLGSQLAVPMSVGASAGAAAARQRWHSCRVQRERPLAWRVRGRGRRAVEHDAGERRRGGPGASGAVGARGGGGRDAR